MGLHNFQRRTVIQNLATLLATISIIINSHYVLAAELGGNYGRTSITLARRRLDIPPNFASLEARQATTGPPLSGSPPTTATSNASPNPEPVGSRPGGTSSQPTTPTAPHSATPVNRDPLGGLLEPALTSPSPIPTVNQNSTTAPIVPTTPSTPSTTTNSSIPAVLPLSQKPQAPTSSSTSRPPVNSGVSTAVPQPESNTSPVPATEKPQAESKSNSAAKTTFKTIGIIGGVIGGLFLLWNIIRKWKFRPSKRFAKKLESYDDDVFNPRPPSFAEKRPTEYNYFNTSPREPHPSSMSPHSGYSAHRISEFSARQYGPNDIKTPQMPPRAGIDNSKSPFV
ncbi:hypothetical protein PPACK8108_LOCUS25359 [Phakopsora pachyrhizi]|uniref:Uncharacterized protein n=1 Tax=Phakopsora pachyrhizi TaxID=170000 RepID=A0AAV0BTS4_PHAPC|nr:hypothetical protein PPACK8108_LOCUS25359 [Phakopsora pachyrhizi]